MVAPHVIWNPNITKFPLKFILNQLNQVYIITADVLEIYFNIIIRSREWCLPLNFHTIIFIHFSSSLFSMQHKSHNLLNTKINYGFHKRPPLLYIVRLQNPIHILSSYSPRSILILSVQLRLCILLYAFCMPHSTHRRNLVTFMKFTKDEASTVCRTKLQNPGFNGSDFFPHLRRWHRWDVGVIN